jgi:hypothetical protein
MSIPRSRRCSLLFAFILPFALAACGGQKDTKHANPKAGSMPEGGEWPGVYYSQLYGYLHILVDGSSANGAWRTTAGDSFGELHGEIDGNLLKYAWQERMIGAVGADANRKGAGYFVYTVPKAGEAHEIVGEWGLGDENAGNEWKAVKQKNMAPNPASVKPDEIEGRVTGVDSWDEGAEGGGEEGGENKDSGSDSESK